MYIALIMMQKNESELLPKWIEYHGVIFGFNNLFIFDNGSTDLAIFSILSHYANKGVNIIYDKNSAVDFENKGVIISKKIKELDVLGVYDFFIPLDCDEFLGVMAESGVVSNSKKRFEKEFSLHVNSKDTLLINSQFFNSPISDEYFIRRADRKCFFAKGGCDSLDVGFHWGKSINGGEHSTGIIQFHFHNKPFDLLQSHAKEKLKSRVNVDDVHALTSYKGNGSHLVGYLLQSESQWLQSVLSRDVFINTKVLKQTFNELSIAWPFLDFMNKSFDSRVKSYSNISNIDASFDSCHKFAFSSLDNIKLDNRLVNFSGWCFDAYGKSISSFGVVINDCFFVSINAQPVRRIDVKAAHDYKHWHFFDEVDPFCGFIITVDLSEFEKLNKLDLYGACSPDNLGGLIFSSSF